MSMYALLRNNPQPSVKDMESAFEGRCKDTQYIHSSEFLNISKVKYITCLRMVRRII